MVKVGLLALALSFAQAQPVQPAPESNVTVAASGDFLIHTPVAARALALGGGSTYDFAPLFDRVKRHIAGADLALCHVETPLVPGPVMGYPSFRTPPALARSIKKVGWDACSTASNHTPRRRAVRHRHDAAGARPRRHPALGQRPLAR